MLPPLTRLLRRGPRHFSISQSTLTAKHSIYVSQSTDPYFNLSFEDWYGSTLGIYFAVSGEYNVRGSGYSRRSRFRSHSCSSTATNHALL